MGNALRARFQRRRDSADLTRAIDAYREAIRLTPPAGPPSATYQSNLALTLIALADTGEAPPRTRAAATQACLTAAAQTFAPPTVRLRAARKAAELLAETDPIGAADAAATAVTQIPHVVTRALRRAEQEERMTDLSDLACDAAALHLAVQDYNRAERAASALQCLETGQAVMLSQVLAAPNEMDALVTAHPELGWRVREVGRLLNDSGTEPSGLERPLDPYSWSLHQGRR